MNLRHWYLNMSRASDSALVAFAGRRIQVAEIAADAGNADDAGLFVHQVIHGFGVQVFFFHQEGDDRRIDVAAAGAHAEAGQRRQAHRGVDAAAVLDGSDRRTVAQMAGDDLQAVIRLAEDLGRPARHIAVRGAVEAVFADAELLIQIIGQGVHVGLGRHGLVESRIEDGDLGNAGHGFLAGFDAGHVRRIVQRRQIEAGADRPLDFRCDQDGGGEFLTAMDDPVADGIDLAHALEDAVFVRGQDGQDSLDRNLVVGHVDRQGDGFAAVAVVLDQRVVQADAFSEALGQDFAGCGIRAAGISAKSCRH